ncbi:MAG: EAL domain-containing protein [Magnetococcales bacterium]|nr:EAL domain-containing protein [Magnetococcales bacterium]
MAGREIDFFFLIEHLPDGILVQRQDQVLYANPAVTALVGGREPPALAGRPFLTLFDADSQTTVANLLRDLDHLGHPSPPTEARLLRTNDKPATVELTLGTAQLDGQDTILAVVRDITQRKEAEERIRHQANYDALTGLPNRALFLDRLQHELIRARRSHSRVALMFIDLDRFKWVNDTLGHAAGDRLLQEASQRLLSCHRESDTVARLGGDEFTVILPDMAHGPHAERVAAQILRVLEQPFILEGQEAFISGSVGVTIFPDDADSVDGLLKNADSAMYHAKADGRNAYRFFTPDMHAEALEKMELEKDLHRALQRNELVIHYQPIVNLQTGQLVGAEGLLRWKHRTRGFVSPEVFVQLAEETGLSAALTEWTLRTGCSQAQKWRELGGWDFFISLNLACTRCRELSTDDKIASIFQETGLPPTALVLEVTENILSEDGARAMGMLNHLKKLGVSLWLDDFGTGYSSLSVLKKLPVSGVKIDRTFIPEVSRDPESEVLVKAIMSLAKSLGRMVIGEGVETRDQMEFLKTRGCDFAQGYHFDRPLPADEFAALVKPRKVFL